MPYEPWTVIDASHSSRLWIAWSPAEPQESLCPSSAKAIFATSVCCRQVGHFTHLSWTFFPLSSRSVIANKPSRNRCELKLNDIYIREHKAVAGRRYSKQTTIKGEKKNIRQDVDIDGGLPVMSHSMDSGNLLLNEIFVQMEESRFYQKIQTCTLGLYRQYTIFPFEESFWTNYRFCRADGHVIEVRDEHLHLQQVRCPHGKTIFRMVNVSWQTGHVSLSPVGMHSFFCSIEVDTVASSSVTEEWFRLLNGFFCLASTRPWGKFN